MSQTIDYSYSDLPDDEIAAHIKKLQAEQAKVAYRLLRVGFAEQLRRLCEISTLRERYVTQAKERQEEAKRMQQARSFRFTGGLC